MKLILFSRKNKNLFCKISKVDEKRVKKFNWFLMNSSGYKYAARITTLNGKRRLILLHRFVMKCPANRIVDHIDKDTLNNTRSNLRLCTRTQNIWNRKKRKNAKSSKYIGISWDQGAYVVRVQKNKVHYYGGRFKDEIEAAKKHDEMALKHHGKFASLNFPVTIAK